MYYIHNVDFVNSQDTRIDN